MATNMTSIAVIPARGGSKRIPDKNARDFCGLPMIARSINVAVESSLFDRVIVSTDNRRIAAIAREYGAETPFDRPTDLADDHAPTIKVIQHAAQWLAAEGCSPNLLCCIYATAPFVRVSDLVAAHDRLVGDPEITMCIPVTSFPFPIQRALRMGSDGAIAMLNSEHMHTRSQDLEPAWHDTGQFYYGRFARWLAGEPIFQGGCAGLAIEPWRVQDIDTPDDWTRAELLFRLINRG